MSQAMRSFVVAAVLALAASPSARAAVTITVSPRAGGGTTFEIQQTAPSPVVTLPMFTVGYIAGIWLAEESLAESAPLGTTPLIFSGPVGRVVDLENGAAQDFDRFVIFEAGAELRAEFRLEDLLTLGEENFYRFEVEDFSAVETAIAFGSFRAGTWVESDVVFGSITTVVVPEPSAMALLAIGVMTVASRRRR